MNKDSVCGHITFIQISQIISGMLPSNKGHTRSICSLIPPVSSLPLSRICRNPNHSAYDQIIPEQYAVVRSYLGEACVPAPCSIDIIISHWTWHILYELRNMNKRSLQEATTPRTTANQQQERSLRVVC